MPKRTILHKAICCLIITITIIGLLSGALISFCASSGTGTASASPAPGKSADKLIDLEKLPSGLVFDLKYATAGNFTGIKLYSSNICCLQEGTAWKLVRANEMLMKSGYRIKVWDAYRPLSVQKKMWKIMPDSRFLANPYNGGSKHNKGAAVDVTLTDMAGKELEMPSSFDDFTGRASRLSEKMTATARKNLKILTDAMTANGFKYINTEWWHFDDTDSSKYKVLDVKPEDVSKRKLPVEVLQCTSDSRQVILVTNKDMKSSKAILQIYEKTDGKWLKAAPDMNAVIGRNGFKKVKNSPLSKTDKLLYKYEGDGCSPMGAFTIDTLFGWGPGQDFKMPFRRTTVDDYWVSGKTRDIYNVPVNKKGGPDKSWAVFEKLAIPEYKYAAVINYNTGPDRIVGNGSAIFLHIAGKKGYTSGCTAISQDDLLKVLKWLDPARKPLIVQGTPHELGLESLVP